MDGSIPYTFDGLMTRNIENTETLNTNPPMDIPTGGRLNPAHSPDLCPVGFPRVRYRYRYRYRYRTGIGAPVPF